MDAQMPRRQDGEERPGRHPAGSLRSSRPAARKELAIFNRSDTFSLTPQSTAVLGGRPVTLGGRFLSLCHSREGGNPGEWGTGVSRCHREPTQQGVAISGLRLPRSLRSLAMTRYDYVVESE